MIDSLLGNPVLLLVFIIVLGELIGRLEWLGFSFGSAAIIFVAIGFGYYGYQVPDSFKTLGLVLFIYTIGLQAGPGIKNSFNRSGVFLSLGALFLVSVGFLASLAVAWPAGYSADITAGLFAGALTSTPGLAVASELGKGDAVAAAYGVTYSFGVIGVILFIRFSPLLFKVNVKKEEEFLQAQIEASWPAVLYQHVRVENRNVCGRQVRDLGLSEMATVTITRRQSTSSKTTEVVSGNTRIEAGDILRIVGTAEELRKAEIIFGKRVRKEIHFTGQLTHRKIVVSRPEFVGQTMHAMNLHHTFNVQVSRLNRNGIDIPVTPHRRLQVGDILHVVGPRDSIDNLSRHLGNDYKLVFSTNLLGVFIGIAVGFLLGKIPLTLPGLGVIKAGTTGGVLLSGLVLGYLYHTRTFVWQIPVPANNLLRHTGLAFFMAAVGTQAGATILPTVQAYGLSLLAAGMAVTLLPLVAGYFFCRYAFRIPYLHTLGVLSGGMTSTPGLASVNSLTETGFASSAYATVYPVALVAMIVFTKIILYIL
ncbi:MAG: hypothetical protein KDK39_11455 [Leptospiraceae bacterium]|nr:hypothetical protein [Leptospiraceae bacterium]